VLMSLQNHPCTVHRVQHDLYSRQKLTDFIGCLQTIYFGHRDV
jgi:hypothetical protein